MKIDPKKDLILTKMAFHINKVYTHAKIDSLIKCTKLSRYGGTYIANFSLVICAWWKWIHDFIKSNWHCSSKTGNQQTKVKMNTSNVYQKSCIKILNQTALWIYSAHNVYAWLLWTVLGSPLLKCVKEIFWDIEKLTKHTLKFGFVKESTTLCYM